MCDEMGQLVFGAFYCDSALEPKPAADDGWNDWVVATAREWTRALRGHPSVVLYRPMCRAPQGGRSGRARLQEEVRKNDGTRPLTDRKEVWDYAQGALGRGGQPDDASRMAETLSRTPIPFITNEIWFGRIGEEDLIRFFTAYYDKSFEGGATGMIPQHVSYKRAVGFNVTWPSASGAGNRSTGGRITGRWSNCPNWCDPARPAWEETSQGRVFRRLYEKHVGRAPEPFSGELPGDVLASGLAPRKPAFLVPADPTSAPPAGVVAAPDGTAWFVVPTAGPHRLVHEGGAVGVNVAAQPPALKPGYEHIQRVEIGEQP